MQGPALAERFAERPQGGFIAPKNKLEALVASIYADIRSIPEKSRSCSRAILRLRRLSSSVCLHLSVIKG
jgi:hypothetical protein